MLKERIISGLIGVVLILSILYAGGVYWIAFFTFLGLGGLYEFNRIFKKEYNPPILVGVILFLITMFYLYNKSLILSLVLFMVFLVIYLIIKYPKVSIVDITLSIFPALYIGFSFSFALLILEEPHAFLIMLSIFLLTWTSDIGGYFFGSLWGKRKIAPKLSPNKTWAGSIGGIILSLITALIFYKYAQIGNHNLFNLIILGIMASIAAQAGDLFISSVKRIFAVKDTGSLIPGHGGILDRFDSFILVLPVVFALLTYFT